MNTIHHAAARHRRKTHAARKAGLAGVQDRLYKDGKGKERVARSRNRQEAQAVEKGFDIQIQPIKL